MIITREAFERREEELLSEGACLSKQSKGRTHEEAPDGMRTIFQRDRDRIIHSKSFRRLKHKTQVFLSPEGDHYRTRLTHTLEVSQIARSIARALGLNEDLTEAIALAHDLGHTPFGHCGEDTLNKIHPGGFIHAKQSLRVVTYIEKRPYKSFRGLNLSWEVLDGIVNHTGKDKASTLEGQIIKFADRIAYINHDIDDAIRADLLSEKQINDYTVSLGERSSERIHTMIMDVIEHSTPSEIQMSLPVYQDMMRLRDFLFENLYRNPEAKSEEGRAANMITMLYEYFSIHPDQMSEEFFENYQVEGLEAVKDYVAGMTDRYAVTRFKKLFIPDFWQ